MAITPQQLIAPEGELESWMFASQDAMEEAAAAYLAQGYVKAADLTDGQDDAAAAWAYYRAFKAIVLRITATPAKATLDSGKTEREYTAEQIKDLKGQRDLWLSTFEGYFSESSVGVAVGKINDPTPPNTVFI